MKQVIATMVLVALFAAGMPSIANSAEIATPPAAPARVASLPRAGNTYFFPLVSRTIVNPPSPCSTPLPPIYWDWRLGPGGLDRLQNVRLIPASVQSCQKFWRVVSVVFQDWYESGGNHNIYVQVKDENGNRINGQILQVSSDSTGEVYGYPSEKPAWDLCDCNFDYPMYGDGYNVRIVNNLPSDMVAGMVLPLNRHVNYRIIFQRAINSGQ